MLINQHIALYQILLNQDIYLYQCHTLSIVRMIGMS
ncbi:hypothetical protein YPPY48_4829, partial [Yersinia pestis PY-48]